MAPVLNSNVFKCVMPIFANEMVSSLPGNTKHIIHKLGNTILSSVYNTFNGAFSNGYLVDNTKCNWKIIDEHLAKVPNDLSVLTKQCSGTSVPIHSINENNIILEQVVTPYQNGTANILAQDYDIVNGNMFSLDDAIHYLGLEDCSVDTAKDKLQEYYDYLQSLIPTTTTTTEAPTAVLKNLLGSLGDEAYKLLKEWGYITDPTPTPCPTPSPNDDTNNGGYTGAYIAGVAVSTLAVGAILGYAAKYGWDWYKGGSKVEVTAKFSSNQLSSDAIYEMQQNITSLIKKLQSLPQDEEYEEIDEEASTGELNLDNLVLCLNKFNKNLKHNKDVFQTLNELTKLTDQGNDLKSNVCEQKLHILQDMLSDNASLADSRVDESSNLMGEG